jgi:hypothetical protein
MDLDAASWISVDYRCFLGNAVNSGVPRMPMSRCWKLFLAATLLAAYLIAAYEVAAAQTMCSGRLRHAKKLYAPVPNGGVMNALCDRLGAPVVDFTITGDGTIEGESVFEE